jgi:hypothetical protein
MEVVMMDKQFRARTSSYMFSIPAQANTKYPVTNYPSHIPIITPSLNILTKERREDVMSTPKPIPTQIQVKYTSKPSQRMNPTQRLDPEQCNSISSHIQPIKAEKVH